ncbi:unnamed protein product [Choristocarpus tenellus]
MMGNGVDRRDGAVTDSGETGLIDRSSAALGIGDAPLPAEQAHAMEGRIESMGYEVGYRLVERTCQQRWMAGDHLEAIKFVCKDLWVELFKKQVDKLQTDHRGTFVLKDANFLWTLRYASDDTPGSRDLVGRLLHFPCGLVRGALANLGMIAAVRADFVNESGEASVLPAVSFTIKVHMEFPQSDLLLWATFFLAQSEHMNLPFNMSHTLPHMPW